jgi:hypothetical protein
MLCSQKHQRGRDYGVGMDMERDELTMKTVQFIAGEIGGAVELIIEGVVIDRDAIVDKLEAKRRSVGNVIIPQGAAA